MPDSDATGSKSAKKEHHEFAERMWARMDRDGSGRITRSELDCEEFRTIIRSVLVPGKNASTGGAIYARSQTNTAQAVNFCLRKADLNRDSCLTFKEFESFLLMLAKERNTVRTAYLIFALFDLNCNGYVDQQEFREICRFYLGRNATHDEFTQQWSKLSCKEPEKVTIADYIRWLQTSDNPVFRQHAPEEDPQALEAAATTSPKAATWAEGCGTEKASSSTHGDMKYKTWGHGLCGGDRPLWIHRLNKINLNPVLPPGQRNYFSRPQSLPELGQYYDTHRGFSQHRRAGTAIMEPKRKSEVLSNHLHSTLPYRHVPGGKMRAHGKAGKATLWEDYWQVPIALKPRMKPAVLDFQHPGPPPRWMSHYKEDAD